MRRALLVALAVTLAGCGGFDNTPFRVGVVRGVVPNPTVNTVVLVEQQPALSARPDAQGRFELVDVPQGEVTLLVLASAANAERLTVTVRGGDVVDTGAVGTKAGARLEIVVHVPSNQSRLQTRIQVGSVTLTQLLDREGEVHVALPTGCYPVVVSIPGLGTMERQVCVTAPTMRQVQFELPEPDGSPGREGCSVSGCEVGLTCRSNGSCG